MVQKRNQLLNLNQLNIGVLCLLYGIAGGITGYNLKSRTQNISKHEPASDFPAMQQDLDQNTDHTNLDARDEQMVVLEPATVHTEYDATQQYNDKKQGINNRVTTIHSLASQQGVEIDLDEQAKTEVKFLNSLDQSPHTILPLLNTYEQSPDGETKDLLRSLLATTGNLEIEQRAIEQVTSGDLTNRADWLALLRDTGIHSSQGRNALLNQLPNFDQPEELSSAILAFAPQIVSASQRQDLIDQLSPYLNHNDDIVRNAAVESLSKWADSGQSYILEQALTDSSEGVRQAAVLAAFTSTIKSDYIKTILLDIMLDDDENQSLRMDAHNALTGYTLQDTEYDEFFQFHQQQTENINIDEARG